MTKDRLRGWFVANVRELPWQENELGATCEFDKQRERFDEFGINLTVLRPGQPMTMYHREGYQEGFLVLRGECLLIIEGSEVRLREWDYFHCPRDVAHAIVGSGAGLSLVLAVGSRVGPDVILYPRDETALSTVLGLSGTRRIRKRPTHGLPGPRLRSASATSSSQTSRRTPRRSNSSGVSDERWQTQASVRARP
jgi:uncharacterized cupin superfamily protein